MTELEIMRRAKEYLDKLANGVNPITGREVPEYDTINNVHISRCLFYASGILQQVIDNGGTVSASTKANTLMPFSLSFEDRSRYAFGEWPLSVSQIAQRINELADLSVMKKLKTTSITAFLVQSGLLAEEKGPDGHTNKRPTAEGRRLGISTIVRSGQYGEYTAVVYDREAQQFILDNLDAVIAINTVPPHENQGKPWAHEDDDWLRHAARSGADIREMSAHLKRSRKAIRARLEKLNLTE